MKKRSLYRFLWLLLVCWLFYSQEKAYAGNLLRSEYSYRRYTIHDGLPNLLLETIFQDNRGFLWIGTYKGFVRFDGISFTPFLSETAINILRFENCTDGSIRAYTYHDVYIVDRNDSVRTIQVSPEGVYLNTYNTRNLPEGYLIYENEDATEKYLMLFRNDTLTESLRCTALNEINNTKPFLDVANNKFYLPSANGLNIYDRNTKQTVRVDGLVVENFLLHRTLGLLAFGTDGIYRITGHTYEKLADGCFAEDKQTVELSDGSLIIKDRKSAYRYCKDSVERIATFNTGIVDLLCDEEDNLWLASHDGLYNFFRLDFRNYYLEKDVIKTVLPDDTGNHWIGTFSGNLLRLSGGAARRIHYPQLSSGNRSFLYGSALMDGCLYFPRDNGVLRYEKGAFSWADLPYRSEDYDGYSKVVPCKDGNILIMRGTGVYLCDRYGKVIRFFSEEELKQQDFQDLVVDEEGRWVISGHAGVSVVEGDSVRLFKGENSVVSVPVCIDKQGRIWSGSGNRLNLLRNDSMVTVHRFSNDAVQGIFNVDKDYLLITTLHGIHFFHVSEYIRSGRLQLLHYNHNNGFTGMNAQVCALFTDAGGRCWLPCNDCLVTFQPRQLIRQMQPPRLHILAYETSADNVHWLSTNGSDGVFSHKNRNFRFSFIGIDYSDVENVRYTYRLKGFQDEWSEPTKLREVRFNNLPPGDYIFEIYAKAGMDDLRSETRQVRFTIRPAFWQTKWFVTVAILLLMLASTGIALYIQHRKNNRLIERLEIEKQLNELRVKSIRLRSIPHFNANVLAAIEYYVMNLSKDDANRLLNIYSEFTSQTLREVDKASRSLHDELDYVQLYLQLEKLRFMEKFSYEVDIDPAVKQDVQLPNMILHTYCENAVKHGFSSRASGCRLKISARQKEDVVEVSVEDNGVGRVAAAQNKNIRSTRQGLDILHRQIEIYNRFNKKKIVQRIVDLYDGDTPCGTRFMIEVPYEFVYQ